MSLSKLLSWAAKIALSLLFLLGAYFFGSISYNMAMEGIHSQLSDIHKGIIVDYEAKKTNYKKRKPASKIFTRVTEYYQVKNLTDNKIYFFDINGAETTKAGETVLTQRYQIGDTINFLFHRTKKRTVVLAKNRAGFGVFFTALFMLMGSGMCAFAVIKVLKADIFF